MSRSFVVASSLVSLVLVSLVLVSAAAAQDAVPIPGTRASIALPRGCEVAGTGRVSCGSENVDIGGTALSYEELLVTYRANGRGVTELAVQPRAFVTQLRGGRMLLVRDGPDERLLLVGTTSRPRFEAGQVFGHVLVGTTGPARGAIVAGFESLPRERIPYATVYWYDGSLTFSSAAIDAPDTSGASGFFRETQRTTMTELCDNSAILGQLPATLILEHRRQISEELSVCEEAFVVTLPDGRRRLAAQFGYVFGGGHAYSLTMSYGLTETESPFTCLEGFEHFALPALSAVLGVGGAHEGTRDRADARRARTARR